MLRPYGFYQWFLPAVFASDFCLDKNIEVREKTC